MKKLLLLVALTFTGIGAFAQATCAAAVNLTASGTYTVGTITGTYPTTNCWTTAATAPNAMWYKFTPTSGGIITVSSDLAANPIGETGTDSRLAIYSGSCAALTCRAVNDDVDANATVPNYRSKISNFVVTAGTTYYIVWDDNWSTAGFQFEFTFTAQTCFVPTGFAFVTAPTETTASIGWTAPTAGTAPAGYQFEYGPLGFTQGTGTTLNLTSPQADLTGLTDSSVYSFYVRSFCGGSDYSVWVGPISFNTVFLPAALPYTTSFEGTTNFDFLGWVTDGTATADDWFINAAGTGNALVQDGANAIISINSTTAANSKRVYSRGIAMNANDQVNITYWVRNYLASDLSTATSSYALTVGTAQDAASQTTVVTSETGISTVAFLQSTASFTAPTTGTYYFSFLNNSPQNTGDGTNAIIIDNFAVSAPLGVNTVLENQFAVSPNPSHDIVRISSSINANVTAVSIKDINGRTVQQAKFVGNTTVAQVSVSGLATGVYMMTIDSDKGSVTKKIVKK